MRTKDLSPYFYPFQVVVKLIIDREKKRRRTTRNYDMI